MKLFFTAFVFVVMATTLVGAAPKSVKRKVNKPRRNKYGNAQGDSNNNNNNNNNNWPFFGNLTGVRLTDEQKLVMRLFQNYDRYTRPVCNLSDAVTITISMTLTQIFELDEKNQVFITNAWTNLQWVDQHMKWNPADYSGLSTVRILSSKLWIPDIVLYNNAADFSGAVLDTRARVSYNGNIIWYFPFDEQICRMKFGSWTFDGFKVDLVNSSTSVDLSLYVKSGEWDMIHALQKRNVVVYTCCIEPYPDVTFYFHIKRKPLYYSVNVFLPCMMMSGLTLLVFMMPAESGEKIGLGITIMLSFAVFMLSVIERLPDTSESFPLISVFLTFAISTTAISIVITVSLLTVNHKSSEIGKVRKIVDKLSPLCCVTVKPDRYRTSPPRRLGNSRSSIFDDDLYAALASANLYSSIDSMWLGGRSLATSATLSSSTSTTRTVTARELMGNLVDELNESARVMKMRGSSDGQFQSYAEVAEGLSRLLERDQAEDDVEQMMATWRRVAQLIDRSLFWLMLAGVTVFTVFLLILAPTLQLL